jgi:hypothetical protein
MIRASLRRLLRGVRMWRWLVSLVGLLRSAAMGEALAAATNEESGAYRKPRAGCKILSAAAGLSDTAAVRQGRVTLAIVALTFFAASIASAHVGSPNVFFDGKAGEYPVHIVIRPPKVVPGIAEISVRVEGDGVQRVTALPVFWESGRKGSPPPDTAKLVPGETNLYASTLWLMKPGGYSVDVSVEGARGGGTVIVPVNAVATNTRGMSRTMALTLVFLGLLLFVGAVRISGAIFGQSLLEPGEVPNAGRILRGRIAMGATAALFLLALWGGSKWWNLKEREYRNKTLYRPGGLIANVVESTNQNLLVLRVNYPEDSDQSPELIPDHGKLMHLFLIREPDLKVFAHLHPVKRDWEKFEVALPPLPAGHYAVYADITHETAFSETLTTKVDLPPPTSRVMKFWGVTGTATDQICGAMSVRAAPPEGFPLPPDPDDSWHVGSDASATSAKNVARVSDGRSIVWLPPGDLVENRDLSLRFQLMNTNGQVENLEPYIGMFGHAAVRRDDGAVFAHIHPSGTFSMAAQEYFAGRNEVHAPTNAAKPVSEVSFPFAFPNPGVYHLWVQLKSGGKAYTGVFEAVVKAGK